MASAYRFLVISNGERRWGGFIGHRGPPANDYRLDTDNAVANT